MFFGALVASIGLAGAACSDGGGGSSGDRTDTGDGPTDHVFASRTCDPLRGTGTITNQAGEPTAFSVTVRYTYADGEMRPLQSDTTPVLADGESFDFSIGPDVVGGTPSSCSIVSATRVEADPDEVAAVDEREEAEPDADATTATITPAWTTEIDGSISAVALADTTAFAAHVLSTGEGAVTAVDDTGEETWTIELDLRPDQLVADGQGGVLAVSGTTVIAIDDQGDETWRAAALAPAEDRVAGTIDHLAVTDDLVIAGGSAPGAIAGLDLATGDQRWHVPQDETGDPDASGFGGGSDHLSVHDDRLVVAGGTSQNRHLTVWSLSGDDAPELKWTVPDAGQNLSTDGEVIVDAVGDTVTAYDIETGDELWAESDAAWENAAPAGGPAILDDVAIVARANSTVAFDLASGEQRWAQEDLGTFWSATGPDLRVDDRVFGATSLIEYTLLGADGALAELDLDTDLRGNQAGFAAENGRVLIGVRGSTRQQPSSLIALDLNDVG